MKVHAVSIMQCTPIQNALNFSETGNFLSLARNVWSRFISQPKALFPIWNYETTTKISKPCPAQVVQQGFCGSKFTTGEVSCNIYSYLRCLDRLIKTV